MVSWSISWIESASFGQRTDPFSDFERILFGVVSEYRKRTGTTPNQVQEDIDGRRFPGTVRSEEPE